MTISYAFLFSPFGHFISKASNPIQSLSTAHKLTARKLPNKMHNYTDRFQVKLDLSGFEVPTPSLFDFEAAPQPPTAQRATAQSDEVYSDSYARPVRLGLDTTISRKLFDMFDHVAALDRRTPTNALSRLVTLAVENKTLDLRARTGAVVECKGSGVKRLPITARTRIEYAQGFTALCDQSGRSVAGGLRWLILQAVEHNAIDLRGLPSASSS